MHLRALNTVQRVAMIRILSSFRTVATQSLEIETHIPPTQLRMKQRGQSMVAGLYTLPSDHPIRKVVERAERRINLKGSEPKFPLVQTMKTMNLTKLQCLENIDPRPRKPWVKSVFDNISVPENAEEAAEGGISLLSTPETVIYSGACTKKSNSGAAAVTLDRCRNIEQSRRVSIGASKYWSTHTVNLIAIYQAIQLADERETNNNSESAARMRTYTITSTSKAALQTIENPSNKPGQNIIHKILSLSENLKNHHIKLRLLWVPGRTTHPGNEAAYNLAKEAASPSQDHKFSPLISSHRIEIRNRMFQEWKQEWQSSKNGRHLRHIDDGLPAKRTYRLYGPLSRHQTYLLTQLRTGHAWLASYAKLHKHSAVDTCECGARETVVHILVDCPSLGVLRQQLRGKIGDAFNNVSSMLGGKLNNRQGKAQQWSINREVLDAVLEFADASKRFQSRVQGPPQRNRQQPTRGSQ
jgi:ribonuclease HI